MYNIKDIMIRFSIPEQMESKIIKFLAELGVVGWLDPNDEEQVLTHPKLEKLLRCDPEELFVYEYYLEKQLFRLQDILELVADLGEEE